MITWHKQGLVYVPAGSQWWARNYAHLPTAHLQDERTIRIYFASLDAEKYGRIGYVDVAADDPSRILSISAEPVLDLGERGSFDDSGVNPSCVVQVGERTYLYYIGWQRCTRVPYMLFAGLATIGGDAGVQRLQRTPVLDRTPEEPFLRSATSVIYDNSTWRVWYVCAVGWTDIGKAVYPKYVIRTASSKDGVCWSSAGSTCIDFGDEDEFGFGRPWVVRDADCFRMWYSIRSRRRSYRLGYAESRDGFTWQRMDDRVGITASASGWDSEMICYGCVLDAAGKRYMFYNGNQHGISGFGYAVAE